MIESLPSYWRGTVFRSRTEARWAVFFDAIKLRWEYEPEGFRLADGSWYLPDFWLPEMLVWVEVKPGRGPTDEERSKIEYLVHGSGHSCIVLAGAPWPKPYDECTAGLSPEGFGWTRSHFSDAYTLARRDGEPRLFRGSEDYEAAQEEDVALAMSIARRMDLKEPGAGDYLPLGWEGFELLDDGDESTVESWDEVVDVVDDRGAA